MTPWTNEEDRILKRYYNEGVAVAYEKLDRQRTHDAIAKRAQKFGLRSGACMKNTVKLVANKDFLAFMDGKAVTSINVNEVLRELRVNSGLYQQELADAAGYSIAAVRHVEYDKSRRFQTVSDLLQAMGFELVLRRRDAGGT